MSDKDSHAVVYFWDGRLFSPGVVMGTVGEKLKGLLCDFINWLDAEEDWDHSSTPGAIAALLVVFADGRGITDVSLRNTPDNQSTGTTMVALHQCIIEGCGMLLLNLKTGTFEEWGGCGVHWGADYNYRQVREHKIAAEILGELPPVLLKVPEKKRKKTDAREAADKQGRLGVRRTSA